MRAVLLGALGLVASCYDAGTSPSCALTCATSRLCPEGLSCNNAGVCSIGGAACGAGDGDGGVDAPDSTCANECDLPLPRAIPDVPEGSITGRTLYVTTTGIDTGNDCASATNPCGTVQYAVDLITPNAGDVVLVGGGTYSAPGTDPLRFLALEPRHSGSAVAPTVIRNWPGRGVPIIDASMRDYGIGFCCGNDAAGDVILYGLHVINARETAIHLDGGVRNTVHSCHLSNNGEGPSTIGLDSAVTVKDLAEDTIIANSIIELNSDSEPARNVIGIRVTGDAKQVSIVENTIRANDGVGVQINNSNAVIRQNFIYRNVIGIQITNRDSGVVEVCRNVIAEHAIDGIAIASSRARVLYNTVHGNAMFGLRIQTPSAEVRNNLFTNNLSCGLTANASVNDPIDHHNLYDKNTAGSTCGGVVPDMPDTDLNRDPMYFDTTIFDFRLEAESPARGAGECATTLGAIGP